MPRLTVLTDALRSVTSQPGRPDREEGTDQMKIFIDSADIAEIKEAAAMGVLDGCTTNPSLLAKVGRKNRNSHPRDLRDRRWPRFLRGCRNRLRGDAQGRTLSRQTPQ